MAVPARAVLFPEKVLSIFAEQESRQESRSIQPVWSLKTKKQRF